MNTIPSLTPPKPGPFHVTPERVSVSIRSRFNPIQGLTPGVLVDRLERWQAGYLRDFALTAETIEERDYIIKAVASKRKKAVARLGWDILTTEDSPAAQEQQAALEYFYNNAVATNAFDADESGGIKLIIRQMMDAVGKGYAVHEIIWRPTGNGQISAEFRFVPLYLFENTTGRLRFLRQDFDTQGEELEADGWMVTKGDCLMIASAIAYLFKQLPMKDWLIWSEKFGMPIIRGVSQAARGSQEWNDMVQAVRSFAADFAIVTSPGESIELTAAGDAGALPYPALVERMDRMLATLWCGGDLSTLSSGQQAVGGSLQGNESSMMREDDAEIITETLQAHVDRAVIRFLFGKDATPLAYFQLHAARTPATASDISIDQFLLRCGAKLSLKGTMERYGRPMPKDGEAVLSYSPMANCAPQRREDPPRAMKITLTNYSRLAAIG